jgi:AraC family transcriptional regulator of adaptative response / DNA-3-methyladenine glycosylase II
MRAMHWPDAFSAQDAELQRLWRAADASELEHAAEAWRPWRAHAATYLRASGGQPLGSPLRAVT